MARLRDLLIVLVVIAFRNITEDARTGVIAALLFYVSPAMLVHSTLPISDPGALALFGVSLFLATRLMESPNERSAVLFGAVAAITVGWRLQFSIVMVPLLFAVLCFTKGWRRRALVLVAFAVVCVAWLLPLTIATGGIEGLITFETRQAQYLAEHDADTSRSGWTPAALALRFIAHPWGTKFMALPMLLFALGGAIVLAVKRRTTAVPFAMAATVYLAFALWTLDPADGVRYALPWVVFVAFLAGVGMV
jgi:hypothetical protein